MYSRTANEVSLYTCNSLTLYLDIVTVCKGIKQSSDLHKVKVQSVLMAFFGPSFMVVIALSLYDNYKRIRLPSYFNSSTGWHPGAESALAFRFEFTCACS